jgi:hypothetical protein
MPAALTMSHPALLAKVRLTETEWIAFIRTLPLAPFEVLQHLTTNLGEASAKNKVGFENVESNDTKAVHALVALVLEAMQGLMT